LDINFQMGRGFQEKGMEARHFLLEKQDFCCRVLLTEGDPMLRLHLSRPHSTSFSCSVPLPGKRFACQMP
jgi:hypothetical protein